MDNNEKTSEKITKWLLVVISVLFLAGCAPDDRRIFEPPLWN